MSTHILSKRLQTAANYIISGDRLADIGSDHAYLPCYLAENGLLSFAIAGEVADGPLNRSKKEVSKRHLEELIHVRKGNGLDILEEDDQINVVSICGMGGILIERILESGRKNGNLKTVKKIILQPNRDESRVRRWLDHNQFVIQDESIIEENDKMYEVILAVKVPIKKSPEYTEKEYRYGVCLSKDCSSVYLKKWTEELKKKENILSKLTHSSKEGQNKTKTLLQEIQEIKEMMIVCQK